MLSVIIVNYNSGPMLARCLKHLSAQSRRDFETLVFDNASVDDSLALARAVAPEARVLASDVNLGFAAANNRAAAVARGDWLVFLNPDAYAEPDWLEELVRASERYPWAEAFGSAQLSAGDQGVIDGAGDVFHAFGLAYRGHFGWSRDALPGDGECFAPCGAAAMYRRQTFLDLGGFDERFFCYCEDVDLGFRLRLAGGRAVQVSGARVCHEGSGVTGRYSDFTVYHGNRNRIWVTFKNMPAILYWPLLPARLLSDLYLLYRAFSVGGGRPYWRALRDGYLGLPGLRADRRRLQRARRVSIGALSRALTWSLTKVSRREADLKPIEVRHAP